MGRSVNLTILLGNVGADPEIRYTSNGTPVARFSLATNSQYTVSFRQRCVIEKSGAISWAEPRGYGARKCVRC
jgi:hypothetical protein